MGASRMPPVPPRSRSTKGPGDQTKPKRDTTRKTEEVNTEEQGRFGNINQNAHAKTHGSGR